MERSSRDDEAGPPAPERPPPRRADGLASPPRHWSISPTSERGLNSSSSSSEDSSEEGSSRDGARSSGTS
eukprot:14158728-Alexandrium_andersonii.AAC.1